MVIEVCLGSAILFHMFDVGWTEWTRTLNVTVLGNVTFILNGESLEAADAYVRVHMRMAEGRGRQRQEAGVSRGTPTRRAATKKAHNSGLVEEYIELRQDRGDTKLAAKLRDECQCKVNWLHLRGL